MKKICTSSKSKYAILLFCGLVTMIFLLHHYDLHAKQNNTAINQANDLSNFNSNAKNYNSKLQILNKAGNLVHQFDVAVADSREKVMYGLMNLPKMPQNHGMIFLLPEEQEMTMWMKNTLIALDMLFIDKNNIIVNIKHQATPLSLEQIPSKFKVLKVLEINGGLAKKLGIEIGQKIIFQRS